ncbi:hypothetical protein B7R54_17700 [Subtercola boreus]|uniref:Cytochrome b561 bacterial/Ni-hydrogenase domain-containing protein n=1 Tax=Subtercola boreus TaxID=120213 RepID=A0A3E0VNB5_9MICO|nr:hypothetical protein B7R54_17700 [Subtercola boreus]
MPRQAGGEPWPPATADSDPAPAGLTVETSSAEAPPAPSDAAAAVPSSAPVVPASGAATATIADPIVAAPEPAPAPAPAPTSATRTVRQGLPRVVGGEPWPSVSAIEVAASATHDAAPAAAAPAAAAPATPTPAAAPTAEPDTSAAEPSAESDTGTAEPSAAPASGPRRRTGLPRPGTAAGSEPATASSGTTPTPTSDDPAASAGPGAPESETDAAPAAAPAATRTPETAPAPEQAAVAASAAPTRATASPRAPIIIRTDAAPAPAAPTKAAPAKAAPAKAAPAASATAAPAPAAVSAGLARLWQLPRPAQIVLGLIALLVVAAVAVLAVRGITTYRFVQDFLQTYPGEYPLPDTVETGFPAWIGWQHFLNAFFIVLIIRSGWQVRTQKRPSAFWTARGKTKGKISLTLWFHQFLDVLWLANGVVFVVLIFVTGHWLRLVPSSWEVFPNALSALIHYLTLEWPTDNGWVNYNSLQQLMYFIVVFIAAPLAALTGVRMSGIWPKNAKRLNTMYPIEVARAIHFPVMLFFVGFVIVHVALVFATGALRNLNHMYGGSDDVNWIGFGIFFASLAVMVAGWIAARPLVIAPIASLFGKVSAR